MSFRDNNAGRYGHVPPARYPVAGHPQDHHHQQQQQQADMNRRMSFNNGDDGTYYGQGQPQNNQARQIGYGMAPQGTGTDELFLGSPTRSSRAHSSASNNPAFSGYRHQYQGDPAAPPTPTHSYNPQSFASPTGYLPQNSGSVSYHNSNSPRYPAPSPPANFPSQNYDPSVYASSAHGATSPQRPGTHYGRSSADPGYMAAGGHQASTAYPQAPSPGVTYSPSFSSNYRQPVSSPSAGPMSPQAQIPSYDPSQFAPSQFVSPSLNGVGVGPGAGYSQAPYPTTSQIPVGPEYSEHATWHGRDARSNSQTSPMVSPTGFSQMPGGVQRHPTNAPLPTRPQDGSANGRRWNDDYRDDYDHETQESIMQDIEAELGSLGIRNRPPSGPVNGQYAAPQDQGQVNRYNSTATTVAHSSSRSSGHQSHNSHSGSTFLDESDDDDPEGTAGVLAMQQAELDERRFSGSTFTYSEPHLEYKNNDLPPPAEEQPRDSDSDYGDMDIGMLSGGYPGTLTYGGDMSPPHSSRAHDIARPLPSPSDFPTGPTRSSTIDEAKMDYGGTGGLQPPTAHRQSFDEGDERLSLHSRQSGTESPAKEDAFHQDLFYHPGLTNRPLPAIPPQNTGSESSSMLSVNTNVRGHRSTPSQDARHANDPESFYSGNSPYSPHPERSISLGHSHTPIVQTPARSRTDAAEERRKLHRQHQVVTQAGPFSEYDPSNTGAIGGAFDSITLPSGRKKKFIPSKLTASEFKRCTEPWALSSIEKWIRVMADEEPDLRNKVVEDALIHLFTAKVPTMNVADAELLSNRVVSLMLASGVLVPDEEWVKFGNGHLSGVLWQMTGSGCYSPKVHDHEASSGRCYSYHCTRTLKKVDLDDLDPGIAKPTDEWHVFYSLKKEDWESKPKKEVDRQNILHEVVTGEENYIKQLDVFRMLYRDDLRSRNPPIVKPDRQDKLLTAVFGKVDTVLRINKDHLLSPLKYRQQEQGPWIVGFSDIFREWIRKAKSDYIEYALAYPRAQFMVRREAERNVLFRKFLEEKRQHKLSGKQDWTHFLITPLQRLQRYILLLESIDHKMVNDSEEKSNLQTAIQEIKTVTLECDAKVEETNKRVQMMELDRMLVMRPGFQAVLNLDHLSRQLIIEGELQRMGSKAIRWVDTHALLFDHYLILAKVIYSRDRGEKKYDVSKEPIPMPLLFLESMNDEPITRQKGITAPLGRTATAQIGSNTQLNKISSNSSGRPTLDHVATSSSMNSNHLTPTGSNDTEGKILYPFRVKHLGHEVYTLYASSARDRMEWCQRIVEAKTNHAKSLYAQNAEPFSLRVLADASFHYDASSIYARTAGVPVKGTPLDRAIDHLEGVLGSAHGIAPVCRAQVNCATGFTAFGKPIIAIGTDYGVFISDPSNPRGWTRTVQASRVTQMAILEDFSVCLVIADRSLISYPLDVVAPVSDFAPPASDNPRRAPQRLAKDVTYFATAKMKDRMLVFYKRKEGLHTMFKVLEPIHHKATEKRSRLFGGRRQAPGSAETFRDFDEFFFPTDCFSLSLFQTYIAVSTSKGIEMLTLDKKQPLSIPDLKAPAIANIAGRIRDQKPLGMFRLNENEFILTYEDCAVYVDKHGDVSRTLIMEYTGKQKKARGATMYGQYLLLFNEDYVEVRNADNGRLRQIIAGRDVRVLDYGVRGPTGGNSASAQQLQHPIPGQNGSQIGDGSKGTVKIVMSHPELQGRQIVLEMLLNDGHTEA